MKPKKLATLVYTLSVRIDRPTLDRLVSAAVSQERRMSDLVRLLLKRCIEKCA
jgi:hypothetical protein